MLLLSLQEAFHKHDGEDLDTSNECSGNEFSDEEINSSFEIVDNNTEEYEEAAAADIVCEQFLGVPEYAPAFRDCLEPIEEVDKPENVEPINTQASYPPNQEALYPGQRFCGLFDSEIESDFEYAQQHAINKEPEKVKEGTKKRKGEGLLREEIAPSFLASMSCHSSSQRAIKTAWEWHLANCFKTCGAILELAGPENVPSLVTQLQDGEFVDANEIGISFQTLMRDSDEVMPTVLTTVKTEDKEVNRLLIDVDVIPTWVERHKIIHEVAFVPVILMSINFYFVCLNQKFHFRSRRSFNFTKGYMKNWANLRMSPMPACQLMV